MQFDYAAAFSRNVGWLTLSEQYQLRKKRVAIAGMGGAGGAHLLTLTRLGIGKFHIADFDTFELHNLNRQAGASMSHIDQAKVEVMAKLARDINPQLQLKCFAQGVTSDNLEEFLADVDLYIDGLDFFAFEAREMVFAACANLNVPAITVAPLGMSAALLTFMPGQMSLEEFFQVAGKSEAEKALRFLLGLAPAALHFRYLADPSQVDLAQHRGPSTGMACQICAGIAGTEAVKILLGRGRVYCAPYGVHFDAYSNRLKITWRPGGNRNPLQTLALAIGRKRLAGLQSAKKPYLPQTTMQRILDLARWAPSGDNIQPWRFEIKTPTRVLVHLRDRSDTDVYDFKAWPSRLAFGALIESLRVAASGFGHRLEWQYRDVGEHRHLLDVTLGREDAAEDDTFPYLSSRSVNRRPYRMRPLEKFEKEELAATVGEEFRLSWYETLSARWACSSLNTQASAIRLNIPEAYRVHQEILDWEHALSPDRVPSTAIGIDGATLKLMRWAMQSWGRIQFLNGLPGGTLIPRLEMDWLPGVFCAAHFTVASRTPFDPDDAELCLRAGQAMQRFWLRAEKLKLALQPSLAPIVFSAYARAKISFTQNQSILARADGLARAAERLFPDAKQILFFGRIGESGKPAANRSTRKDLSDLLINP